MLRSSSCLPSGSSVPLSPVPIPRRLRNAGRADVQRTTPAPASEYARRVTQSIREPAAAPPPHTSTSSIGHVPPRDSSQLKPTMRIWASSAADTATVYASQSFMGLRPAVQRGLLRERESNALSTEPETRALGRALELDDHPVLIPHHGRACPSAGRRPSSNSGVVPRKVRELREVRHLPLGRGTGHPHLSHGKPFDLHGVRLPLIGQDP